MSDTPAPPRMLPWLVAGFTLWGSALVALYALHAIGCAFGWPSATLRLWLTMILLAHLAALTLMWHLLQRPRPDFLRTAAIWATIAALVATFLTLAPPLVLTACA